MSNVTKADSTVSEDLKDWTIMVYMAGDNNLSENMAVALDEISTSARTFNDGKANLLAFFDSSSLTAPTQYFDYSDLSETNPNPISHTITKKDLVYPKKSYGRNKVSKNDVPEGNSASAYSIMNFVHWCIETQKRKANNYVIIFSGHSFGFHGTSFLRDETEGGFITLFKFRWALEQIQKDLLDKKKFAILGFDSCVMSMLEVGYELKKVAQTIVASEGSLPNSGWSYAPMLQNFLPRFKNVIKTQVTEAFKDPASLENLFKTFGLNPNILNPVTGLPMSAGLIPQSFWNPNEETSIDVNVLIDLVMKEIVSLPEYIKLTAKGFVQSLLENHNKLLIGGRSIDISAWNLEVVDDVARNLNNLAKEFNRHFFIYDKIQNDCLKDDEVLLYNELKKIVLQCHYETQTYMHEQCIDLEDFCKRLIIECKYMKDSKHSPVYAKLVKLAKAVISNIDKCVLKSGFSGDEYQFSNGISLYFPWSSLTFSLTEYRYRYLTFSSGKIKKKDIDNPLKYKGIGKDWYLFLLIYLFGVTLRSSRKVKVDNEEKISILEDFSKDNPLWSKLNPVWSSKNPLWSKSNPRASRSNPRASRSNPRASRSNPRASKGEIGEYLFYFSRFKNFENRWNISGFADEFPFEVDFDSK